MKPKPILTFQDKCKDCNGFSKCTCKFGFVEKSVYLLDDFLLDDFKTIPFKDYKIMRIGDFRKHKEKIRTKLWGISIYEKLLVVKK